MSTLEYSMHRIGAIIRNTCLAIVTVAILAALVAADWYVRYDPEFKARRFLESQAIPLDAEGARQSAEKGKLYNLEHLSALGVDLGRPDPGSGVTPLLAALRADRSEAVEFLLGREDVQATLDVETTSEESDSAMKYALSERNFSLAQRLLGLGADVGVRIDPEFPLLVQAYRENDWATFDFLVDNGVTPDGLATDGLALMADAIRREDGERIGRLLEAGASVNVVGVTGDPMLYEVVGTGNHDLASRLLGAGARPDALGASGQSALFSAVRAGRPEMVALLLEHGADPNLGGRKQSSPLEIATAAQDVDLMQVLIQAGARVTSPRLLKTAFGNRDLPGMAVLLRAGAEPDVKIGGGRTLLDGALASRSINMARTLLEAGAAAEGRLWSALESGDTELVSMVLQFGASVREAHPVHGLPLDGALERGDSEIVSLLLSHGADPNVTRVTGESWVAESIREGDEQVVEALLSHGACLEGLETSDGHSLLGWAIAHGMREVVAQLIAEGADVRAREPAPASKEFTAAFERSKTFRWHLQADSKINPLMLAAAQGDVEIAQMLIDAGAKKGEYSRRYLWPVNVAAWHMDVDMMQVILGRDPDPERQPRKVIVNLSSQRAVLYENGRVSYNTKISTGKKGYRTPTGTYVITDKHRHHTSSIYGSSMPYFMRLSCAAFGLHEGYVPNYPASHGCIRVPRTGAAHLFARCEVGDVVEITY